MKILKSNTLFITMLLLLWINYGGYSQTLEETEIEYTKTEAIWPGCFGVLGTIQDEACLHDLEANGITPRISRNLEAGNYAITGTTAGGEKWQDNEVYLTAEMLEDGFCCARLAALGKPCPPDAGICDFVKETLKTTKKKVNNCDEDPVGKIIGDSLIITWCDKRFAYHIPENKYSIERKSICEGETYEWHGRSLTKAGNYQHQVTQDSVVILNLDVTTLPVTHLNERLQPGDTVNFAGKSITSAGTYRDTLKTQEECDSIVVLNVTKDKPEPCEVRDSAWQQNSGLQLEVFATSDSKIGYEGQSFMKILNPQFGARAGYEWRLTNNSFWLNKLDCVGESFKLYGGLKSTPNTFIVDECACNNVSNNNLWTYFAGAEYRVHLYRLWPINFSLGIGGEILYNKTRIDDPELAKQTSDWHGDIFISPRVDYTLPSDGNLQLGMFLETPIRVLNNPYRGVGINLGVRISLGGGSSKSTTTVEDEDDLLENNPSFETSDDEDETNLLINEGAQ